MRTSAKGKRGRHRRSFSGPGTDVEAPRAFTLVEVLAALLLVAIVLPVVMHGVAVGTNAAAQSRRRTEAASLAQSKLSELVATEDWRNGVLAGRFDAYNGENGAEYGWQAELRPWSQEYVKELAVSITWGAERVDQTVTLTTLVYEGRPKTQDELDAEQNQGTSAGTGAGGAS